MSFFQNLAVKALTSLVGKQTPSDIRFDGVSILAGAKRTPPKRGTKQILDAYSTMACLRETPNNNSRAGGATEWKI